MRVTPATTTHPTKYHAKHSGPIPPAMVLHTKDSWELLDATTNRFHTGVGRGWQSVIKHHCDKLQGAPYWMLLEWHSTPTRCNYCSEEMPASIVCLFKLQNMDAMR